MLWSKFWAFLTGGKAVRLVDRRGNAEYHVAYKNEGGNWYVPWGFVKLDLAEDGGVYGIHHGDLTWKFV